MGPHGRQREQWLFIAAVEIDRTRRLLEGRLYETPIVLRRERPAEDGTGRRPIYRNAIWGETF